MMLIRMGMLCCPIWDEEAAAVLRRQLHARLAQLHVLQEKAVPHQSRVIEETLRTWCDEEELDLILTVGGTRPAPGPSAQERMPDATQAVSERLLPGLAEEMRAYAREQSPLALLDRSIAGIRGRTLLLNLPAGARAASLFLQAVIEVIPPLLLHLHEDAAVPDLDAELIMVTEGQGATEAMASDASQAVSQPSSVNDATSKLDFAEFATFLARKSERDQ